MSRKIASLVREEKSLVLKGRMLDAITHYTERTGHKLYETRIAIFNWLKSSEAYRV